MVLGSARAQAQAQAQNWVAFRLKRRIGLGGAQDWVGWCGVDIEVAHAEAMQLREGREHGAHHSGRLPR